LAPRRNRMSVVDDYLDAAHFFGGLPPFSPFAREEAVLRGDLIRPRAAAADFTGDIS